MKPDSASPTDAAKRHDACATQGECDRILDERGDVREVLAERSDHTVTGHNTAATIASEGYRTTTG